MNKLSSSEKQLPQEIHSDINIGVNLGHPDINYVAQANTFGIEAERVTKPQDIKAALNRCQKAMKAGKPYVVDVKIAKRFHGKESDWYDFVSIAKMQNG